MAFFEDNFDTLVAGALAAFEQIEPTRVYYHNDQTVPAYGGNVNVKGFASEHGEAQIIYSSLNNHPFEITVRPFTGRSGYSYRWVHPAFAEIRNEQLGSSVTTMPFDKTVTDEKWVETEGLEDILAKAKSIYRGEPFDSNVIAVLELQDDEILLVQKMADERKIGFNEMIVTLLELSINRGSEPAA